MFLHHYNCNVIYYLYKLKTTNIFLVHGRTQDLGQEGQSSFYDRLAEPHAIHLYYCCSRE